MNRDKDRIERAVDIAANRQHVWDLVSEPGWWINDGRIVEHRLVVDGDVTTVHDPVHGAFPIRTVALEPPAYAAFRWLAFADDGPTHRELSLVEFFVDELPGGCRLRVVESGLASLNASNQRRREMYEENSAGWELELELARRLLAAPGDAR